MLNFLEWLERTPAGVLARESLWGFPILVGIHILGLTVSVGIGPAGTGAVLRLLGCVQERPIDL